MDDRLPNKVRLNRHRKRKNNDLVAAMYAMYKTGRSLDQIASVYGKTRQAVYDVFRTRGYTLRSKASAGLYFTTCYGVKWYKTKGGYLRGTVDGRRTTLHREVWERSFGSVPTTHVIRFKDGDPTKCTLSNLELVEKSKMAVTFNPTGKNQYLKA